MTQIDRYILVFFLRTSLICFCSIAGIFIVFHAFTSLDDLVRQGQVEDGLVRVMMRYYGPYLLLLFDWTGAIIVLMALLFTVGWIRRAGELTAILSAGIFVPTTAVRSTPCSPPPAPAPDRMTPTCRSCRAIILPGRIDAWPD